MEILKDYWISAANWDSNELEITLSPVSRPKFIIRLKGHNNTDKIFELMRDRDTPVRDFIIDANNKTLSASPNIALNIISVKSEGK